MPDFYAYYPFPEVVLKIADPEKFCAIGDAIAGMKSGQGRVEKFVEGGILVHPTDPNDFCVGDTLVSPTSVTVIAEMSDA